MQLTLKNLLLYLDDALPPQEAALIGQRIADNPNAQRLIEVLRTLTRRRVLPAPDVEGAKDPDHDPNQVAAYLDGFLEEADAAAFERLCLEDAALLAEVATVHQLTSLGQGEPVLVPPKARQRLYGLVSGQEADPKRRPKPVPDSAYEMPVEVDGQPAEGEGELFFEPLWFKFQKSWQGRFVPLAALLLLVCLAVLIYFATQSRSEPGKAGGVVAVGGGSTGRTGPGVAAHQPANTSSTVPALGTPAVASAVALPTEAAPPTRPAEPAPTLVAAAEQPRQPATTLPQAAPPSGQPGEAPRPTTAPTPTAALPLPTTTPTPTATLPAPTATMPAATAPTPTTPTPTAPAPTKPADSEPAKPVAPPRPAVPNVAVGQYVSDPAKDGLVFCRTLEQKWILERPQARLLTGEPILALPGSRADFLLANKMKLILHGTMPGAMSINYFFETLATVHFNETVDLDISLERGRLQLTGKPDGIAAVKLRFHEHSWDLRLLTPDTEIGIEVTGRVPPGTGEWIPHSRLAIFVMRGEITAKRGEGEERIGARKVLVWDSVHSEGGPGLTVPQSEPPAWLTRRPAYPAEVRDALAAFQRRLNDKLAAQGQDLAWMAVAADEAISQSRRPWEQYLAVFVLAALDQLGPVIETVDHPDNPYLRRAAIDALLHFLGRQPGQGAAVSQALIERGYAPADREIFLKLVRRIDKPDRAAIEQLLEWLNHPRLAIRELAFLNLVTLLPTDRLVGYDPAAPTDQRERAIGQLRSRLLK